MKKITKIALSTLLSATLFLSATPVFAASTNWNLTTSQTSSLSVILGLNKTGDCSGSNNSSSSDGVFLILHSSEPGKGWMKQGEYLMEPGRNGTIASVTLITASSWRGELNPWWWNGTGCSASGTLNTSN